MITGYVMAVPWDLARVKRAKEIRAAAGETKIIWDQTKNAMDTFRSLLSQVAEDGDNSFILFQDDIILTKNWRTKAEKVIAERPSQVVQFFSMEKEDKAREEGSRERKGETYISNLCTYFPAGYASQLLDFSYSFVESYPKFKTGDDFVVRYWLKSRKEAYWLHYPNLVQHEGWKSSINSKRPTWRKSNFFDEEV